MNVRLPVLCLLLGAVVPLTSCRTRQDAVITAPVASTAVVSTAVASPAVVSTAPAGSEAAAPPAANTWVAAARLAFTQNQGRRDERQDLTFARVRFGLPELSPSFIERNCPAQADCRERTRYVRLGSSKDGLEFLPDCSVLDEERLLDELSLLGPWQGAGSTFTSGQRLQLVGRAGQRLSVLLEFVENPRPTAPSIWDEWLYARSVASAYAASQGLDAPLLGKLLRQEQCASANTALCEAELATLGNPLAMLAATPNCAVGVTTAECLRRHVLLPVDVGYFQNFCGRTWLGEAASHFEGGRGPELVHIGVELQRLLAGTAWTSFGHRVPQTDVFALSRAVLAMGLQGELGPKFAAVARNTDVSFRNRYRARVLSLSFESELDEAALLREFRAVVSPCVPGTNPEACAPQPNDAQLDLTCIQHTLGLANLACAHG